MMKLANAIRKLGKYGEVQRKMFAGHTRYSAVVGNHEVGFTALADGQHADWFTVQKLGTNRLGVIDVENLSQAIRRALMKYRSERLEPANSFAGFTVYVLCRPGQLLKKYVRIGFVARWHETEDLGFIGMAEGWANGKVPTSVFLDFVVDKAPPEFSSWVSEIRGKLIPAVS